MKFVLLGLTLFVSCFSHAGPAVPFEEVEVPASSNAIEKSTPHRRTQESEITPLSQRSSLKAQYQSQEFDSTADLRTKRRVGIGAMTSGTVGMLGALLELNLSPSHSAIVAYGGGPGYNAFNFQWKYNFGGESFSPYAGFGYSQWNNASGGGRVGKTTPAALGSKFLTEEEKRSGQFSVNLLTPTLGIQYNQLFGEYTGASVFGEIVLLTKVSDLSPVATGALGILYYF